MRNSKLIQAIPMILAAVLLITSVTQAVVVPVNNNCANATAVTEVESLAFDTTNATFDGPGIVITSPNIWYIYTASCTGNVTISLCGSQYDTVLAVYSGSACNPTAGRLLTWNDDSCDFQSQVIIAATAGSKYLIEIGGYDGAKGQGVLTIRCPQQSCAPANDNCANAQPIGNVTNLAFNTTCATLDGPSVCKPSGAGPNIWYKYTATCTAKVTISLCGSSFDTILAVFNGYQCPPQQSKLLACNDDFCGQQSQVTINATAGNQYLIEVGGFSSNQKGQGLLTVSCAVQAPNHTDLGDAPDSSNNYGVTMTAYSTPTVVEANYPTVFADSNTAGPFGPIHLDPKKVAYLGNTVTFENEADKGPDEDSLNNIAPASNANNQDQGDDGVIFPIKMPSCGWTTFDYTVNVVDPNIDMWVNVWFDFNRDGDWNDTNLPSTTTACPNTPVSEWAVRNQLLFNLPVGLNKITTPGFTCWNPDDKSKNIWMRITLSEQPWKGGSGAGGSGPANGYQDGETEDYYFLPDTTCKYCEDLNQDGQINLNDLWILMEQWLNNCPH
jgi:hypothetical protein